MRAERLAASAVGGPATPALAVPALLLVLAVAGLGISSYLTYAHWADASIACTGLESCDTVNSSEYAEMASIPVAFLGALFYLTLIVVALAWLWWRPQGLTWPVMAFWGLSLGGVIYSAYLTYLELFVINAICIWCVASAVVLVALFGLSTIEVRRVTQGDEERDPE